VWADEQCSEKGHSGQRMGGRTLWAEHVKEGEARMYCAHRRLRLPLPYRPSSCVAVVRGHSAAVSSVSFSCKQSALTSEGAAGGVVMGPSFIVSGGEDRTLKRFDVHDALRGALRPRRGKNQHVDDDVPSGEPVVLTAAATQLAHLKSVQAVLRAGAGRAWPAGGQAPVRFGAPSLPPLPRRCMRRRDINAVTVAPNDSLIATGSQDRLVKVSVGVLQAEHCRRAFVPPALQASCFALTPLRLPTERRSCHLTRYPHRSCGTAKTWHPLRR